MRSVLDFSRRRTLKLVGSSRPDYDAGAAESVTISPGLYRLSSTGPFVMEAGPVAPTIDSFWVDGDVSPIEISWEGGQMSVAAATGKPVLFHLVPILEVAG